MSPNRAFRLTFATAVAVEGVHWMLPTDIAANTLFIGFVIDYFLLAVFGFLAVLDGHRYRYVFLATWAFIGLWFAVGVISFIVGRGEVPPDWTPEKTRLAFWGYVFSTVVFLPVAFASSGLGIFAARLVSRFRHGPPNAA